VDRMTLTPDEQQRLDRLFRLYNSRVVGLARLHANTVDEADDIAADVWLVAARWIHTLQADDDAAMGWLATLTRHAVRDYYKPRRNRELPRDWSDKAAAFPLPASPSAEEVALADDSEPELPAYLSTVVDALPDRCQVVVRLRAEGFSHPAIDARIGCRRASSSRWQVALQTLRPALAERVGAREVAAA